MQEKKKKKKVNKLEDIKNVNVFIYKYINIQQKYKR